jgi:DNA-binding PadR family transcriptional regulator
MLTKKKKIIDRIKDKPYFNKDNFVLYKDDSLKILEQLPENSDEFNAEKKSFSNMLSKLKKQGFIEKESSNKNICFYKITKEGKSKLKKNKEESMPSINYQKKQKKKTLSWLYLIYRKSISVKEIG